ncbi:MAG: methionyl-tRNA formyltransferase [Ruminococcaceae bacterium]|nr:methionyl-tRNA formyltransferase [Oscillospiraceae bacterium]
MKILFMGTPDFALFSLKALVEYSKNSDIEICGVITQPDKPKGRGYALMPPPIKEYALEAGLEVYQPNTLKDESFYELLSKLSPDLIAVVAYGKILPKNVIDFPKYGCINVHGSLLPEYRGAAPMQRAIIDGKEKTGITIMYMAEGLDTGDMLYKKELPIKETDNFENIHDGLGILGANMLVEIIPMLREGSATRTPQDDTLSSYAKKITKDDCLVDFSKDAKTIHNQIRGLSPVPLSFTHTPNGKILKLISSRIANTDTPHETVGEVLSLDGTIEIACAKGSVYIDRVLPEGKSRMSASDFIRGRNISVGEIFK